MNNTQHLGFGVFSGDLNFMVLNHPEKLKAVFDGKVIIGDRLIKNNQFVANEIHYILSIAINERSRKVALVLAKTNGTKIEVHNIVSKRFTDHKSLLHIIGCMTDGIPRSKIYIKVVMSAFFQRLGLIGFLKKDGFNCLVFYAGVTGLDNKNIGIYVSNFSRCMVFMAKKIKSGEFKIFASDKGSHIVSAKTQMKLIKKINVPFEYDEINRFHVSWFKNKSKRIHHSAKLFALAAIFD